MNNGKFDRLLTLSPNARDELFWWLHNINDATKPLTQTKPSLIISTDASTIGWGAHCPTLSTGGLWSADEQKRHINYLEMYAIFLSLQTIAKNLNNTHIRIMSDNTTAVGVLNRMGTSHSKSCNKLCKTIWQWCMSRKIWLSVAHIPGHDNTSADRV